MSKEGRLSRVGVLAPAALSACMDASVLAVPAASAIVSTVLKELSKAFMLKKWFHGNISAKEAEELMMERGKHGSFLVRESRGRPGDYVLTIRSKCRVSHVVIRKQNDKYDIGTGEEFDDLTGLIEHFRKFPIVETSGEMLRLLQPLGGLCIRGIESEGCDEETKRERAACMKIKREKWRKEFQILQFLDNIMYFTTSEAKKLENLLKNRYRDVRPYDQTRVILSKRNEHDSDYINANYIKNEHMFYSTFNGYRSSNESIISSQSLLEHSEKAESELRASKSLTENNTHDVKRSLPLEKYDNTPITGNEVMYIATQGCLFETTNDFWRMIYQEDIRIIVMVARECERGKIKCARYWPDRKKKAYFDRFKVVCFSEKIQEEYLVRELEVYDEMNNCRTVYQYQYFAWPDHGAPMQVNGILGLIDDINACISSIMRYRNSPDKVIICVHCSAGIGRTGTFIALHMLIDKINNAGLDANLNVFETVKLIRSQRSGMVQSEDQYAFINCAVEEYVNIHEKKRGKKNKFLFLKN